MQSFKAACEKENRDPDTMRKSVQALVFITSDESSADSLRAKVPADRSIVGTPQQLVSEVQKYADLGFDEVCVPDFTLGGSAAQRLDSYSTFWTEVAAHIQ
jgi:alkanesulfonate monooxygenase SsuD/methylene tetrahydromethanopterin reductase-like flavin-dependent oxidoreductase (luciferase family)